MKRSIWLLLSAFALPLLARGAEPALLDALRADQTSAVASLLAGGADPNTRDDMGATALMYAAIYSSADTVRLLLKSRADVNAANATGSTALMWAAGDAVKTRLLIEHGAAVNARAGDGTTALLVAARYGNAEALRALLAAGADLKVAPNDALLRAVFVRDNSDEVQRVLQQAGVVLRDPSRLNALFLTSGTAVTNFAAAKPTLASAGKDSQDLQIATLRLPPLSLVAYHGEVDLMRSLIERGADVNGKTSRGATALMLAAAGPQPSPRAVRLLLAKGADIKARDDMGRTALDWALTQGETPVARILRDAGAPASEISPAPAPVARPRAARDAIQLAVARLQPASPAFNNRTKCISCHNQSLPSMAVTHAAARDIAVDRALAAHPAEATLMSWRAAREALLLGRPSIGGFVANVTYGLVALADERLQPNLTTDAVAIALAAVQRSDGSWNIDDLRPPLIDQSAVHFTALAIRGLSVYSPPGRREETKVRLARATEFVRRAVPRSTQDEVFKALGLFWSGVPPEELSRQAKRLTTLQRENGGWGQLPGLAADAYATGQALYALNLAGVPVTSDAYRRGVAFLLRTQLEDGTWFVRSRAFGFQPYFETGFPHGRDQFISAAATSWAAIALAQSLPH